MKSDMALARRLEAAEALNGIACCETQPGAAVERVSGGYAIFVGVNSMLTHAVGMGLDGPVLAAELERVEDFFRSRGAGVNIDLCPYVHPTLLELVRRRGYCLVEFNNVLVYSLSGVECAPADPRVRAAGSSEAELWAHTVGAGFFERDRLDPDELEVGRTLFRTRGTQCLLAFDGEGPAAAAALRIHERLAGLFADSTVTCFRGKGLQTALILERLNQAIRAGCDLATASTFPGSVSERNYQRLGFRVAYTKVMMSL